MITHASPNSGPSCHIASKHPQLKGLILECPFTSIMRVVSSSVLARPIDMFKNIDKIDQVKFPVLIMHGTEDDVVPFEHGKALWEKVPEKYKYEPQWVRNGTHHDIIELLTVKGYITILTTFLKYCQTFVDDRDKDGLVIEPVSNSSSSWFSFSSPSN